MNDPPSARGSPDFRNSTPHDSHLAVQEVRKNRLERWESAPLLAFSTVLEYLGRSARLDLLARLELLARPANRGVCGRSSDPYFR